MTIYKVSIEAMQQHIADKSHLNRETSNFQKAAARVKELSDAHNIDVPEIIEEKNQSFGGVGHDYRIILEVIQ